MSTLLYVASSPRGAASDSRALASVFLDAYQEAHREDRIVTLDLWEEPLPRFGPEGASAKMSVFGGEELTVEQKQAWEQARRYADQFASADKYLFSVPMWNLSIPYVLKQWIDIVTQPGITFAFEEARGYVPVLHGKKATAVYTSSVYYPGAPASYSRDFQSEYLKEWLHVTGVDDMTEIRFQPIYLSPNRDEDRAAALDTARDAGKSF
ncbi:FMN-dependent NADH-azoreductase [Streptomyces sp. AK02-01A]|uniref:FMN-dependent NADH-azoreductase n=1 Tax=Streptomyces sp. AK02-01A TaxID=3028648 RepID=UPI0029BB69EE|nr:NAD(P)H-dependent oxidoreductase [Streptomyces sp. AK02-01A]MDX3854891.1 NAD(P)H-dependent oxidoreductase [Streptomyces sp. AK02-01A]